MADGLDQVMGQEVLRVAQMLARSRLAHTSYLAGGTALAVQVGHRQSLDLDLFRRGVTEKIPLQSISREMERVFGRDSLRPVQRQVDQVTWSVSGVQVTFLAYPFPLLYDLVRGETIDERLRGLLLASPREIALMKAYALGRRATFRDYIDLYFLLKREIICLDDLVREATRKFVLDGTAMFPARLFYEQLVYLGDVDDVDATLRMLRKPITPREVEAFFRREVAAAARRQVQEAERDR